jgi:hypothetical protein
MAKETDRKLSLLAGFTASANSSTFKGPSLKCLQNYFGILSIMLPEAANMCSQMKKIDLII